MKNENTELVVLQTLEVVPFFTKGDNLDEILEAIAKQARAHVPDLSTVASRGEITKNITNIVTESKTYLENSGKELSAEYKAMPKIIDANRKKAKDFLTALQIELRQPLTDWEAEQARIKEEKRKAKEEAERLAQIEADHEMALLLNEKFDREAEDARIEDERLEAERVAKEKADQLAREEQIRKEAEEKAKVDAEREKQQLVIDAAHSEALLINRDIDDAADKIRREEEQERQRLQAEEDKAKADAEAKRLAKEEADRIEREKQEAIEREQQAIKDKEESERLRIQAEKDAEAAKVEAAAKAEREKKEAAEKARKAEVLRQMAEKKAEAKKIADREANRKHVGRIRTEAKEDLMSLDIDEATAKKVVLAIHANQIRNVRISY